MGYADGYYYGQGRIICDTSTFSVGDTIRVRSMTDSNKVWNKTVATVGTALVFTVPCYDYYKICTVQTINDTPTEIGGVYKTVDYGQTLFINVLDKTTLGGIQGILNAHNENYALNIGDEVTIKVNDGGTPTDWVMQIAGIDVYNSHDIMFTSKNISKSSISVQYNYATSTLRQYAQDFYADIDNNDKQYIKQVTRSCRNANGTFTNYDDYCFVLGNKETGNVTSYGVVASQVQMPLFVTQANRIKTYNGTANAYWTSDDMDTANGKIYVKNDGSLAATGSIACGLVTSFMLIADS